MIWFIAVFLYVPNPTAAYAIGQPTNGEYTEECVSTQFANKGDAMAGGKSPYLKRRVRATDVGVAHRTLPFGTKIEITLERTGKTTTAVVIDRGPFGRLDENGKWYSGAAFYRKHKGGKIPADGWVGCLDSTPPVIDALDHNGKERVKFRVIEWPETNV